MILDALKKISADMIVAIIAIITVVSSLIGTYIKYRIDKGVIDAKFKIMGDRMDEFEKDLDEHIEENNIAFQKIHSENRQDHQLLFQRLDDIKNFMITGKFPD